MFDPLKLSKVPAQSELYYWADYVELLCLVDGDASFSAARLASSAKFADDLLATSPDAQDADQGDVADALEGLDVPPELVEEAAQIFDDGDAGLPTESAASTYSDFGRAAEETDNRYRWCQDIFRLLASRQTSLGALYPFAVDAKAMRIERLPEDASHRPYVYYLCCSLLPYVSGATLQTLTSTFELVSLEVLRQIVPAGAVLDLYGTARGLAPSRFTGDNYARVRTLARELRGKLIAEETDFHPRDQGDNGLDLVAWLPVDDPAEGVVAFFAQCACGRGWDGKQYSASHERWSQLIHLKSQPIKVTFIPHYFRKVGDHWYSASDVSGLLIDRLRALRLAASSVLPHMPDELIDDALSFRRSFV